MDMHFAINFILHKFFSLKSCKFTFVQVSSGIRSLEAKLENFIHSGLTCAAVSLRKAATPEIITNSFDPQISVGVQPLCCKGIGVMCQKFKTSFEDARKICPAFVDSVPNFVDFWGDLIL